MGRGLMQGAQRPGTFPEQCLSEYAVVPGSPESGHLQPGLAGAEGVNGVGGSSDSGRVTGPDHGGP